MLNDYLKSLKVKRHLLCHSLAGNKVEYLHITNKPPKNEQDQEEAKKMIKKPKKGDKEVKQIEK